MKIAISIGIEETRNVVAPGSPGMTLPLNSFAESLDKSMTEGTVPLSSSLKERSANDVSLWRLTSMRLREQGDSEAMHTADSLKGRGTDLDEGEELKTVNPFDKPMEPTLVKGKDVVANGSMPAPVPADEASDTGGTLASSNEMKAVFPGMMARIAEEERSIASTQGGVGIKVDPPVAANGAEEKGEIQSGSAITDSQALLSALVRHDIGRHVVHGRGDQKQAGEGVKTEGEKKTSHKAAKKTSTTEMLALGAGVSDQQNAATINAFQWILQGHPAPASAEAKIADTSGKDKHASILDISAGASGRSGAQKMQMPKSAEASQGSKAESSSDSDISSGTEKISGTEVHPAQASAADTAAESGSPIVHGSDKNHLQVEMPGGMAATGAQIQTHTIPGSATDKSVLNTPHMAKEQEDSSSTMSHLYAAGDGQKELVATPTSIEVGVPGGAHGWLKVRAELANDGAVHASMSASSNTGTEMLRRELPSITTFLHQEHVSVSSVVVHAPSGSMNPLDSSNGGAAGYNQGAGRGASDAQNGTGQENTSMSRGEDRSRTAVAEEGGVEDLPSIEYGRAGGWLSVRA